MEPTRFPHILRILPNRSASLAGGRPDENDLAILAMAGALALESLEPESKR